MRNAMIAKLHIAKKELALDEADYRAVLVRATGKSSAAEMSVGEIERAIAAMTALGFKARAARKKADSPLARKIYALWGALADAGAIEDRSNRALSVWLVRQTKIARPEWLKPREANAAIEALKIWLDRATRETA